MIERKSDVLVNPELAWLLAGVLAYKGWGLLESLVGRLLFLLLPLDVADRFLAVTYASYGLNAILVFGLLWLIYKAIKNKQTLFLLNRKLLLGLGIWVIVLYIGEVLLRVLSEEKYSGIIEEFVESESYGIADDLMNYQYSSVIVYYVRGILLMVLFFLSTRKSEEKTPLYEWPITTKNEEVVSSSLGSGVSTLTDEDQMEENSLIQDIIYFKNDKCALIWGNHAEGYTVTEIMSVDELPNHIGASWEPISVSFKEQEGDLVAVTGETTWGGAGFICLKEVNAESFEWFILLSTMNNPTGLTFKNGLVEVNTDLNFPHGVLYTISAFSPEKFTVQPLTGESTVS